MPCVINATGTVVHTGFGRSLLSAAAVKRIVEVATHPCALEVDEATGERSFRDLRVEKLLCLLTSAEAATVVNNNAAAVLLTLNTLADGKEVIVSRGELVEIGGSFRIPEILRKSSAVLVGIGTTNETRISDYESAITERTALLLKVHRATSASSASPSKYHWTNWSRWTQTQPSRRGRFGQRGISRCQSRRH